MKQKKAFYTFRNADTTLGDLKSVENLQFVLFFLSIACINFLNHMKCHNQFYIYSSNRYNSSGGLKLCSKNKLNFQMGQVRCDNNVHIVCVWRVILVSMWVFRCVSSALRLNALNETATKNLTVHSLTSAGRLVGRSFVAVQPIHSRWCLFHTIKFS